MGKVRRHPLGQINQISAQVVKIKWGFGSNHLIHMSYYNLDVLVLQAVQMDSVGQDPTLGVNLSLSVHPHPFICVYCDIACLFQLVITIYM